MEYTFRPGRGKAQERAAQEAGEDSVEKRSLEVALKKANMLLDPNFKRFVVRFVSIGEYKHMMKNGVYKDYIEAMR